MREKRSRKLKRQNGGAKFLVIIFVILLIIAGVLFAMKLVQDNKGENIGSTNTLEEPEVVETKEPKTFAGNSRPIAFMIDNHIDAMPQGGLEQADLIYEIIVEGGETRLMMVMKDQNVDKIGPIRSARHYFIDYAMENDAIYVHFGQSPQAKSDLAKFKINDINGIYEDGASFWRVYNDKYAPHNAVTSIKNLNKVIKREGFKITTDKGNVLKYVAEDFDLEDKKETNEDGEEVVTNIAKKITIPYSSFNTVKYTYNEETKTYTRYSRDNVQKDWNTKKAIEVKNIIITKCKNWSIDSYGRQTIDNVKTLDGYYITNGKYIPIKCEKTSRSSKTVYKDLDGNEINVNDGKTFIQICPINSKISIK